jgi:hypothetical protein
MKHPVWVLSGISETVAGAVVAGMLITIPTRCGSEKKVSFQTLIGIFLLLSGQHHPAAEGRWRRARRILAETADVPRW